MADPTATKIKTASEILTATSEQELLQEIFGQLHPGLTNATKEISAIFTSQSAKAFLTQLTDFQSLLDEADSYEATVRKLQGQIDKAESMRDQLLSQVFEQIRPIEQSYRMLALFFENARVPDAKMQPTPDLFVLNADAASMKDVYSVNIEALENFVRKRNDNFNFRDDICNFVIPGYVPQPVREKLEDIAKTYGMLLVSDLRDDKSVKDVLNQYRDDGDYQFMKRPEDRASASVITMGYLQMREGHWFEQDGAGKDGLWSAPSLVFAAALARTDESTGIAQGPVGSRFGQIAGAIKSRVEPLISEMEHLSMERQVVPIIRDADNHLCFFGCRTLAEDPYGVLKFFTSYRIISYLERCFRHRLLQVAGQVLTRDFMEDQIDKPLRLFLEEQVQQGTILKYDLFVDKSSEKRMMGICDIKLEVMPTGPAETFTLEIATPEFKGEGGEKK